MSSQNALFLILLCLNLLMVNCSRFESSGTLDLASQTCQDDTSSPNPTTCSVSSGRYVTPTAGTNISIWLNLAGLNTVTGLIPMGFYKDQRIEFTDPNLIPANIKSGVTIFNVTGTYAAPTTAPPLIASNMHRDRATTQISLQDEAVLGRGQSYTNQNPGYRAVPQISKDDDGADGGSVIKVDRAGWDNSCNATLGSARGQGPFNTVCKCGLSGSLENRIADCGAHSVLGTNATWDGTTKGNAGQGPWKLVTRTAAPGPTGMAREVWRDERTQLLWSSLVSQSLNWCKATGKNMIQGNPVAEQDNNGSICDGNTLSPISYQATTGLAISACFEDSETFFTNTDPSIDQQGKGHLGLSSTPRVFWRLPTLFDYLRAEIDGLRFVLGDLTTDYEWSATLSDSGPMTFAFLTQDGTLRNISRDTDLSVRCVGH